MCNTHLHTYSTLAISLSHTHTPHGRACHTTRQAHTVHDSENFTFSAYIRADNQRIPCGTISKFYSYNDISNDPCGVFLDPLALLRTKFAFWFPPFSNQIRTEDSCPSARKIHAHPHGKSAAPARKFRGTRAENPRRSAPNNHGIPRKKLSFPCHVLYVHGGFADRLQSHLLLPSCMHAQGIQSTSGCLSHVRKVIHCIW